MRLIGCAQRALELMCQRAVSRVAFGKPLAEQGSVREDIAHSFCEIAQARLLTLQAADKMDREGNKGAPVIDRAIQIHGAAGVSQDTFLARLRLRPLHPHRRRPGPGASGGHRQRADQAGRGDVSRDLTEIARYLGAEIWYHPEPFASFSRGAEQNS